MPSSTPSSALPPEAWHSTLFAKLASQPAFPVFKDRADHFVYDVEEAELTFERDAAGRVTALILHQNGRDIRAPRAAP